MALLVPVLQYASPNVTLIGSTAGGLLDCSDLFMDPAT